MKTKITLMNDKNYIFIRHKKDVLVFTKIFYNDISHVQSDSDYCKIFTKKETYQINSTLDSIINYFPNSSFHRCHRKFIINIDRVEEIKNNCIHVDGSIIPIGESYNEKFFENINFIQTTYQLRKK